MADAVEEVGISEGDVLCSEFALLTNIGRHHLPLNSPESASVHGNNRAMPAQVLADPTSFAVSYLTQ